ncbi:MAG TPA: XRE family transcriptional regulator [Terracidiphilus sp.]
MIRNARDPRNVLPTNSPTGNAQRMEQVIAAMPLDALRDAKQLTQSQMAQLLKISQGAVSKVERRNDMFISTLRNYVRAIGGDLQIRAVFPDGDVLINQFKEREQPQIAGADASLVEGAAESGSAPGDFPLSASGAEETAGPDTE